MVIPDVDCDVGLLLGNDNRKVSQPQGMINAQHGCYAIGGMDHQLPWQIRFIPFERNV